VAANRPDRPGNNRKAKFVLFSIIGIVALIIIGAVNSSHGNKPTASAQGIASSDAEAGASVLAGASTSPATVSQSAASTTPTATTSARPRVITQKSATSRASTAKASATKKAAPEAQPTHSATHSAAAAAPAECTPKTNAGNCYKAGEFCRTADRGTTGIAGNGEAIKCEDNDGWRWEPV
jgi:cytoskeletal protein RodZ